MKPINILWAIPYTSGIIATYIIAASGSAWWSVVVMAIIAFVSTVIFNNYLLANYYEMKPKRILTEDE